ncbi:hypothetical protein [Flexivirga endophytica]|uniref:hypothetical protein n=1 Tax=Flexivirga endophytica TaxID=1849103 RepID=UPI001663F7CF|nr:hypothetical protein [Flexivirga endophytica]
MRQIDAPFDDRGVRFGPPQPSETNESQRRERLRRYRVTLNLDDPADAMKLTASLGNVLQQIMRDAGSGWAATDESLQDKWVQILFEDGFDVDKTTGSVRIRFATGAGITEHALNALPDPQAIHDHLRRLSDSVDTDPRLAVSTAKALIESTAKCVLTARGQTYTRAAKVPALVSAAQESLGLCRRRRGPICMTRSDPLAGGRDSEYQLRRSATADHSFLFGEPR